MGHIFISYSHKDTAYAHALAESLHGMGFEVWIDERLDYGSQWPQELQKQLDSCSAFILIMSPRSYASEWVQSELQRAKRKLKPVFPLLLEGDEPWLSVESTQYYDVRGGVSPDAKFYTALKNVMSTTPAARTLKKPKESRARLTDKSSGLRMGIIIGTIGILLLAFIGYAAYLTRSASGNTADSTLPGEQPTSGEPVSEDTTSQTIPLSQIANVDNHEMALIPASEFTMGGNAADERVDCLENFESECQLSWFIVVEPVHQVDLDAFYIDVYEVTNALYEVCEDQGVCDPPQSLSSNNRLDYYGNPQFGNYPVINVDWNQARTYCEWRGARLPTEAEWEKAARGTDGRMYPWGEGLDESLANFHWSIGDTTEVGSYENGKSPYGLYDMAGNVWEWVNSLDMPYPYSATDGRESLAAAGHRIMRGGGWGADGDISVSTSYRLTREPTHTNIDIGFRCAMGANP